MALLTAGYWPTTYWAENYWTDDYWPDYGAVTGTARRRRRKRKDIFVLLKDINREKRLFRLKKNTRHYLIGLDVLQLYRLEYLM